MINSFNNDIIPATLTDTLNILKIRMSENDILHLPIVQNNMLLGIISTEMIHKSNESSTVGDLDFLSPENKFIFENQHFLETLPLFVEQKLSMVPVLDNQYQFLGILTRIDLIFLLNKFEMFHENGGVLVLEIFKKNLSISEIARIAESSDAKILAFYLSQHTDSEKTYINLKFNLDDLSRIISSYERFGYEIAYSNFVNLKLSETKEHFDMLMRFLNV